MTKPTILLMPGAWHDGSIYNPLAEILRSKGFEAEPITLPSLGVSPTTSAYDDATFIRDRYLNPLIGEGKEIIIVAHSYAGVPGTECVKGFAKKDLASQGQEGGVVGIIYIAASLVPKGWSVERMIGKRLDNLMEMNQDEMMPPKDAEVKFYNDFDEETRKEYLASITPHAPEAMRTVLTYESYRDVDSNYIICLNDAGFPVEGQKMMADMPGEGVIRTYEVDGGHMCMVSRAGDVAGVIFDVAGRVCGSGTEWVDSSELGEGGSRP
ncbi:alpha/beta-hydrolase [Aspergillus filifer]